MQGGGYWQGTTARAGGLLQAAGGIHQLVFRGCVILQILSSLYDGREDNTGISTWRKTICPDWVGAGSKDMDLNKSSHDT